MTLFSDHCKSFYCRLSFQPVASKQGLLGFNTLLVLGCALASALSRDTFYLDVHAHRLESSLLRIVSDHPWGRKLLGVSEPIGYSTFPRSLERLNKRR